MSCALVACSFNDDRKHCSKDSDCASDQRCYEGFCLRSDSESASDSGTGGKSSSGGNGGKGTSSMNNPNTGAGSKATAGTGGSGAAGRGNAADGGAMQAPATGIPGECSDGEERPCLVDPTSTTASELCNRGTQRCGATVWGSCIGQPEPDIEQCNGLDDDCDKKVDEQTEQDCFPDGESGCTRGADGRWSCEGLCAAGKSTCADGRLSYCGGFIAPTAEACAPANTPAADENCDGMIDEACACTAGETRTCYNGREGTLNVGKCVAGMQTCSNGSLGACMNAVIPSAETCANQGVDDDCDGMTDNIPALGSACLVATNMGACRAGLLQCQAGKAEPTCVATLTPLSESCNNLDDDCNGKIDDTFNLQTDAMNCGACGKACAAGEACCGAACVKTVNDANNCGMCGMKCPAGSTCSASKCMTSGTAGTPAAGAGAGPGPGPGGAPAAGSGAAGGPGMPNGCTPSCTGGAICCAGACVDPATDVKHCGMCGTACTSGEQPGCCNSRCVDMVSNNNCGQCGRDCSLLLSGGLTCSCTKGGDGSIACTGPVLNVCL